MLFERIVSPGLAHYSYLIGDGQALVIDPRRDVEVYVQKAAHAGLRITHVLETHRHEDFVVGSVALAERTGAQVWHADAQLDYAYGQPVEDGQTWQLGRLKLQAIHSPGHTLGSMSYLLHDLDGAPWMVFTGDALFAGDVGRVDFLGMDRAGEMAGLLYDTLFNKLLPLGDGVIVCPTHGAGSACGGSIVDRLWTTIGLERRHNPRLQLTEREAFIAHVAKQLEKPLYFERMERLNLEGVPFAGALPFPAPLSADEFAARTGEALVLDTRMDLGFGAGHVPGALSIALSRVPRFAGWFLPYDRPLLLVDETDDLGEAVRYLFRMGYDDLAGTLAGGMLAWHTAGRDSAAVPMLTVQALCRHLDAHEDVWILDVRSQEELEQAGHIPGAHQIHVTQLPGRLDEVPRDRPVAVFCGSGLRAMIAASLLRRAGWENVSVALGGLSGWRSTTCPLE